MGYIRLVFTLGSLLLALVSFAHEGQPVGYYKITPQIEQSVEYVLGLRLNDARDELRKAQREDESNLLIPLVSDYVDFIQLFISEDREQYKAWKGRRDERLNELKKGDENSPYYLYTRAEIHLHWAVLKFRFADYLSAALDINRAFKLFRKNNELFPDFAPNLKSFGMLQAGVGTIPDKYMWAVKWFSSLEGTVPEGMHNLKRSIDLMEGTNMLQLWEARLLYAEALYHFRNDPAGAWEYMSSCGLDPDESLLDCIIMANMAVKTGRNDLTIELLSSCPSGDGRMDVPYTDILLGRSKLQRLDSDADVALRNFLRRGLDRNYVKETYQKLAWHALLFRDARAYHTMMDSCRMFGPSDTDEDAYAMKEAGSSTLPHTGLLRVRLLFDGAYYDRAIAEIDKINQSGLSTEEQLEFEYRYARILDELGQANRAIQRYEQTIRLGKESDRYYACNAALKCGELYEAMGDEQNAMKFFEQCLKMKPSEYQASIHQKAKSGLSRLKEDSRG